MANIQIEKPFPVCVSAKTNDGHRQSHDERESGWRAIGQQQAEHGV